MSSFPLPLIVLADDTATTTDDRTNIESRICESQGGSWIDNSCDFTPPPPPTDVCPNVDGVQESDPCADTVCVSDGGTWTGTTCNMPPPPPSDVCPNVSGNQAIGPCADTQCDANGGTWTGDACSFAAVDTTPSSTSSTDSAEVAPEESDTDNTDFTNIGTPSAPDPDDDRPVVDLSATSTEMAADDPQFIVAGDEDNTGFKTGGTIFTGNATAASSVKNILNITRANVDGPGVTNSSKISASADNWAELTTSDETNARTGQNNASGGDQGSAMVRTGRAVSTAEVMNVVNTNLFNSNGLVLFLNPMNGDGFDLRDFDLSYFYDGGPGASPTQYGCTILTCLNSSDLTIINKNEATVKNTVDVNAETGKNMGTATEDGDVSIETGDAYAAANVLNLVNTNFINSSYLILSMNNFGDLNDDIVLPGAGFFEDLLASGNTLPAMNSSSYVVNNDNDEDFFGTTTARATTGDNTATSTALGHGEIITGNAYTSSNSYTSANQTRVGGASVLLSFRVWGGWSGSIQGLPDGMTWRATRSDDNTSWLIEVYSQGSTGGSATGGLYNSSDFMASSTNKATVTTDVNVRAVTGENSTETEGGVGAIATGDAYAAANVINMVNTNIVNRNWIFASFNIFGDWSGDISFGSHSPDLAVDVTANGTNPYPVASDFQYRFTVTNTGDASASNVVLTADYNKTLLNFVRSTPTSASTATGRSWNLGTLTPGETKQVTMDMRILAQSLPPGASLATPLTANVHSAEQDQNDGDNEATFSITIGTSGESTGGDTGGGTAGGDTNATSTDPGTGSNGSGTGDDETGNNDEEDGSSSENNDNGNTSNEEDNTTPAPSSGGGGGGGGGSSGGGGGGSGGGGGGGGSALASGTAPPSNTNAPTTGGKVGDSVHRKLVGSVVGSSSSDTSKINPSLDPLIIVKKTASFATPGTTTVEYAVEVSNAKNAKPAYYTTLTDTLYDPSGNVIYTRSWPMYTLVPGDLVQLSYSVEFPSNTIPGIYKNIAVVTGQRNETTVEANILRMPGSSGWSEVRFDEVVEQVLGASTTTAAPTACVPLLTMYMRLGTRHEEVRKLQIFLNASPDTQVASVGAGSPGNESIVYGSRTAAAVDAFQLKYAADILTPLGLTQPTGSVYGSTLKKINELACGNTGSTAPAEMNVATPPVEVIEETPAPAVTETETPAPAPLQKTTPAVAPKKEQPKTTSAANNNLRKSFGSWFSSFVPKSE